MYHVYLYIFKDFAGTSSINGTYSKQTSTVAPVAVVRLLNSQNSTDQQLHAYYSTLLLLHLQSIVSIIIIIKKNFSFLN